MAGLVVLVYNFFRSHTALDSRTPAEAADIHTEGNSRVLTLLETVAV